MFLSDVRGSASTPKGNGGWLARLAVRFRNGEGGEVEGEVDAMFSPSVRDIRFEFPGGAAVEQVFDRLFAEFFFTECGEGILESFAISLAIEVMLVPSCSEWGWLPPDLGW